MASLKDAKICFDKLKTADIDKLIDAIRTLLRGNEPDKTSEWDSFIQSGGQILYFLDQQKEKFGGMVDLFSSGNQVSSVVSGMLQCVGGTHWLFAGLSIIGRLVQKKRQMSDNSKDCFRLLQHMLDLAGHIKELGLPINDNRLNRALVIIVKGSMLCAKQLYSNSLFRFLKSSLDKENLQRLRTEIMLLYPNLQLTAVEAIRNNQPAILTATVPAYPDHAVRIEKREKLVMDMLQIGKEDLPFSAVIIYGFGGIGKSTLGKAVFSNLKVDLEAKGYKHTSLLMDPQKDNFTYMQRQILKDLFPNFNGGRPVDLRNPDEGKKRLKRAFEEWNNPVFLFIDNVLRIKDLTELLPTGLERLPGHKPIRLLLTARNLSETNMFERKFCRTYLLKPLSDSDAKEFLRRQTNNRLRTSEVERILKICCGVPLVLEIVCGYLENLGYSAEKISQILDALQKGEPITKSDLSKRMVDDVYRTFEGFTQDAFLDICCFFNGMRRRIVESVVGSVALKALQDAALITIKVKPKYYAPMQKNEEIVDVFDVIRAKGLNMARYTRIRDIQSFEAAVKDKRLVNIKGIKLYPDHSYVVKRDSLDSMSKSLRVVMLGPNISVDTRSKMKFPEVRYVALSLEITCLPFSLVDLDQLAVYQGPLVRRDDRSPKLPQSLRRIILTKPSRQSMPLLVTANSLEEFNLTQFSTKTLPTELLQFRRLKTLKLYNSDEKELPEVICQLHWLTTLSLRICRLRNLPRSFGDLECLRHLAFEDCDRLEGLPSSMVKLKALRYLNLMGCTSLRSLPSTFGELSNLRGLNMKNCASLPEVPGFTKLTKLRYLNIQYCSILSGHFSKIHKGLEIVQS